KSHAVKIIIKLIPSTIIINFLNPFYLIDFFNFIAVLTLLSQTTNSMQYSYGIHINVRLKIFKFILFVGSLSDQANTLSFEVILLFV
ncbi:TPA: hypothetical protein ACUJMO_002269, partial [Streptococcus agalactiae]